MQLPKAIPRVRSILFFRAIAIADPLSAAPPTMARKTMPMRHPTCRGPRRSLQRPDEDLAHQAASPEARTSPPRPWGSSSACLLRVLRPSTLLK
jgi:hypothetical protein